MPLLSSLTGRVDPKRVYLGSVALTAIAFAGLARVATGFWSALAFRALMGTVASAVETVSVTAEAFGWLRTRAALSRLPMTLLWTHRAMGSSLVVHGSVGRTHWRRCVVTRRRRWVWVAPGFLAAVAFSSGTAGATDKTKVDQATKRVERGARQIGQGQVGPGFKEMFTGIGQTIVEGAKFSGENISEFFAGRR